jgi:hypothetical protein
VLAGKIRAATTKKPVGWDTPLESELTPRRNRCVGTTPTERVSNFAFEPQGLEASGVCLRQRIPSSPSLPPSLPPSLSLSLPPSLPAHPRGTLLLRGCGAQERVVSGECITWLVVRAGREGGRGGGREGSLPPEKHAQAKASI